MCTCAHPILRWYTSSVPLTYLICSGTHATRWLDYYGWYDILDIYYISTYTWCMSPNGWYYLHLLVLHPSSTQCACLIHGVCLHLLGGAGTHLGGISSAWWSHLLDTCLLPHLYILDTRWVRLLWMVWYTRYLLHLYIYMVYVSKWVVLALLIWYHPSSTQCTCVCRWYEGPYLLSEDC